jgi:hypothetical protein
MHAIAWPRSTAPSIWRTAASSMRPLPNAIAWSASDCASRIEPRAARAISFSAAGSATTCSVARIVCRWPTIVSIAIGRRLNCRQRDSTVAGTFCGSVVARMNFRYSGGSSSVFSIALKAVVESMCTSSIR